ncbi:MAG: alpha/beta fold hydrolase [Acidobacteriota bacterium]|nr:alpha/beta fold hydrolase [Acidobacteriota bacterium]
MLRESSFAYLLITVGILFPPAAAGADAPPEPEPALRLAACERAGVPEGTRCGTYTVWENRETRKGRKIDLNLVVIPARHPEGNPEPVFLLSGGPGGAATDLIAFLPAFSEVHEVRDIVLLDQRGTGRSNPLGCLPGGGVRELLDFYLSFRVPTDRVEACRDSYDADLTLYHTAIAMDDLDEVREALGYDKIHLWGGSYGTRAALVYMRRHPEHVSTATLRAAVPTTATVPLYFAKDAQVAMDDLFDDCEADPACHEAYPELRAHLDIVLQRLAKKPVRVDFSMQADTFEVEITRDHFAGGLLFLLYHPGMAAAVPEIIESAMAGTYEPFLRTVGPLIRLLGNQISAGMFLSVTCSEDVPFVVAGEIAKETEGTFLGAAMTERFLEVCALWPKGNLPDGYREPVRSEVPVLILSGEIDPTASPRLAAIVSKTLPNSLVVSLPDTGHIPTLPGCTPQIVSAFINTGSLDGLDASCAKSLQ